MIKCIVVDDDVMARKALARLANKVPQLELVASCENTHDAMEIMKKQEIDLLFLDIEMPGSTGFDLLEACAVIPQVIVTTSKEKYAYEAFQYEVEDYLKKPITYPRFRQAVEKIQEKQAKSKLPGSTKDSIFLKVDGRFIQVKLDDIFYLENVGDYVRFHLQDQKYVIHGTIKGLAEKLSSDRFLKVHRSYIVNLNKIVDIEDNTLVIKEQVIPISRAHKPLLMNRLNVL